MTDSMTRERTGDAAYLRWIGVIGLAHPVQDGLRPASFTSLICRAPDTHGAAESIIYVASGRRRALRLRTSATIAVMPTRASSGAAKISGEVPPPPVWQAEPR